MSLSCVTYQLYFFHDFGDPFCRTGHILKTEILTNWKVILESCFKSKFTDPIKL